MTAQQSSPFCTGHLPISSDSTPADIALVPVFARFRRPVAMSSRDEGVGRNVTILIRLRRGYFALCSGSLWHEDDLAGDAARSEQLLRASGLGKRKSPRHEWLDLLLPQEFEQGEQILAKPCRLQPFEPLDAVGDHPSPAREKPAASDVQAEDRDSTKAMTTSWTT